MSLLRLSQRFPGEPASAMSVLDTEWRYLGNGSCYLGAREQQRGARATIPPPHDLEACDLRP